MEGWIYRYLWRYPYTRINELLGGLLNNNSPLNNNNSFRTYYIHINDWNIGVVKASNWEWVLQQYE